MLFEMLNSRRKLFWLLIFAGLVVAGVVVGVRLANGVLLVQEASIELRGLEPKVDEFGTGSVGELALLQGDLGSIQTKLGRGKSQLSPWLHVTHLLGWVPGAGSRLRSAKDIVEVEERLVRSLQDLIAAVNIALPGSDGPAMRLMEGNRINEGAIRSLASGRSFFESALQHLKEVNSDLDRLQSRKLPMEIEGSLDTVRELTPKLEALAQLGLTVSNSWEQLLGYDFPKTYAVVSQNADELRATGGFIPGIWVFTFDQGEITRLDFLDTVELDNLETSPVPPIGILQTLWAGVWLFRDTAWFPDFPTSSRVMEQALRLSQNLSVDGFIAVNQWAIRDVVQAIGPVTLPTQEILDTSSYLQILERGTDVSGRRFMHTVLGSFMDRLRERGSAQDFLALAFAINKSLEQKDILLNFHDDELQAIAEFNEWNGALRSGPGDFLMVVDSNMGFSKVNRNIRQQLQYSVDLVPRGPIPVRLDIVYTNQSYAENAPNCETQGSERVGQGYDDLKHGCYWNYVRVYSPADTSFDASTPFTMPEGALYRTIGYNDVEDTTRIYSETGKSVFAGFFTVGMGESRRIVFQYALPEGTVRHNGTQMAYLLRIQKQPGQQGVGATVAIALPEGYKLLAAKPDPVTVDSQEATFSVVIDSDKTFELVFEQS